MLPTIMSRGPIDLWTRTPRSIAPFSAAAPSHHNLSSADFITNIAESDFWYTQAYFEETKIPHIKPGASAEIYLMDGSPALQGTVSGISMGITDQDNKDGPELLSSVNPSFTWVRLAQRIPVRIHITHVPPGVLLRAGMPC